MLCKNDKAIEQLKMSDNKDLLTRLKCWLREEQGYNLYVFTALFENESELKKIWKDITDIIAVFFQSELEKDIEIWNIYIL